MKIDKHVPIPKTPPESKTAFVREMKVGDSILVSGGYESSEVRRINSALRTAGFKATSRTESGHGKNAKIRIWRIEGSVSRVRTTKSRKVGKHTKAGKRGKIIQCPECSHRMVMSNFAWSKLVCLGCRAEIKKTDFLLPRLSKRQEAKVRATHEAEQVPNELFAALDALDALDADRVLDPDTPVELECKKHGAFMMSPNNHLGDNPEKIAYGCPTCSEHRVQQFCELKVENLGCSLDGSSHKYITTFNALHTFLKTGNGHLAAKIGEMSHDGIVALAKDSRLDSLLKGTLAINAELKDHDE
jgi:DNA-directed RNA polymerase subunit M/transcription elongation factor TFIIS